MRAAALALPLFLAACGAAEAPRPGPGSVILPTEAALSALPFKTGATFVRCAALNGFLYETRLALQGKEDAPEKHRELAESYASIATIRRLFQNGTDLKDEAAKDRVFILIEAEIRRTIEDYEGIAAEDRSTGLDPGRKAGLIWRDFDDCRTYGKDLPEEPGKAI